MSNATADQAEQTGQPDSTAGQVKEAVGGAVGQVQEQAQQAKGQARQRLRQELSTRANAAGESSPAPGRPTRASRSVTPRRRSARPASPYASKARVALRRRWTASQTR